MVLAVGEHLMDGLPAECIRMANGFGGGVGGSHEDMCGALSGAIMVIGGLHGRNSVEQDDQEAQALCAQYRRSFMHEFGVTCCGPLRERVKGPNGPGTCAVVVERAAFLLLDLMDSNRSDDERR
jgi:C_GCAxxG_C_C family probable redox protein